ncbi:MAG: Prochlorococcus phage [Candidatus Parcubacteria bacterium]
MQKDLQSYHVHDSEYRDKKLNNLQIISDLYKKYDEERQFEVTGFARAIERTSPLPETHIDVGCGGGWLLRKTAPLFKEVVGIEPSLEAINYAKTLLSTQFQNISFINAEMLEGIKSCFSRGKSFITTSIVLSHIDDTYVSAFLDEFKYFPDGSILFFDERYGKNIQKDMWHIRSKAWWASQLPDWQLTFFDLNNTGYKSGIYGIKIGKDSIKDVYKMNRFQKIVWGVQGKIHTLLFKLKKLFISKKS